MNEIVITFKQLKILTSNQLAWLIPLFIFLHQLEEYFGNFPDWYSTLLNAQLSNRDFILINSIGLFIFTLSSLSYLFNKNNLILVSLGTLLFTNGLIHLLLSAVTVSYSPGAITGAILFIPSGIFIYKKILPQLEFSKRVLAIAIGLFILFAVSMIANNI